MLAQYAGTMSQPTSPEDITSHLANRKIVEKPGQRPLANLVRYTHQLVPRTKGQANKLSRPWLTGANDRISADVQGIMDIPRERQTTGLVDVQIPFFQKREG